MNIETKNLRKIGESLAQDAAELRKENKLLKNRTIKIESCDDCPACLGICNFSMECDPSIDAIPDNCYLKEGPILLELKEKS